MISDPEKKMRVLMDSLHFHPHKIVKLGEKSRGQIFAVDTFVKNQAYKCVQIFIIWFPSMRSEFQKGAKSVTTSDYFKIDFLKDRTFSIQSHCSEKC